MLGVFLEPYLKNILPVFYIDSFGWTIVGLIGNLLFSSRFLFQWLHSEYKRKLIVPSYFWYLSFFGSIFNLLYAFHLDKVPLILGFCFLPFIYARNIYFLHKK